MKPLTKARVGALHVLAVGPARYSNETVITRNGNGVLRLVHWQSVDWLHAHGYVNRKGDTVTITDAGRERLQAETTGAPR